MGSRHFHQTGKRHLEHKVALVTLRQLQTQLDTFGGYYNEVRPHRFTPAEASPPTRRPPPSSHGWHRGLIRQDVVDQGGTVTLCYLGRLRHLELGRAHAGARVLLLVAGADRRVLAVDGTLVQALTIDPMKDYQRQARQRRDVYTMTRDITRWVGGFPTKPR